MVDMKYLIAGGVSLMIGVFVLFTLVNSLFETTDDSVTAINTTVGDAGYTTEGELFLTSWQLLILALAIAPLGVGVAFIYKAIKL